MPVEHIVFRTAASVAVNGHPMLYYTRVHARSVSGTRLRMAGQRRETARLHLFCKEPVSQKGHLRGLCNAQAHLTGALGNYSVAVDGDAGLLAQPVRRPPATYQHTDSHAAPHLDARGELGARGYSYPGPDTVSRRHVAHGTAAHAAAPCAWFRVDDLCPVGAGGAGSADGRRHHRRRPRRCHHRPQRPGRRQVRHLRLRPPARPPQRLRLRIHRCRRWSFR